MAMRALVTGGGGFLGSAIARKLVARGDAVRSLARGDYPSLRTLGIETIRGDVADPENVRRAAEGCDIIFHVAAKAGVWGPFADYYRANVEGTRNVISACRALGIHRLVYTSSPSVVFNGRDMEGVDESAPYPAHHEAPYAATKAEAERLVLAANVPDLAVVALRPHLIWGPGDNHLVHIGSSPAGARGRLHADRRSLQGTAVRRRRTSITPPMPICLRRTGFGLAPRSPARFTSSRKANRSRSGIS